MKPKKALNPFRAPQHPTLAKLLGQMLETTAISDAVKNSAVEKGYTTRKTGPRFVKKQTHDIT